MAELLTTNESHFFRDGKPFEHLKSILPDAAPCPARRGLPIRIWSAACSTGQEAYSIAILLAEAQEADPGDEGPSLRDHRHRPDCTAVVERAQ